MLFRHAAMEHLEWDMLTCCGCKFFRGGRGTRKSANKLMECHLAQSKVKNKHNSGIHNFKRNNSTLMDTITWIFYPTSKNLTIIHSLYHMQWLRLRIKNSFSRRRKKNVRRWERKMWKKIIYLWGKIKWNTSYSLR